MTLESSLFDLLSPLVSGRVFPDVAPFDTPRPYIVYQQIGGRAPGFMDRTVPSKQNAYMQITSWADTRLASKALALDVEAALTVATTVQASPQSAAVSEHDDELQRSGARQDFSIWADR